MSEPIDPRKLAHYVAALKVAGITPPASRVRDHVEACARLPIPGAVAYLRTVRS